MGWQSVRSAENPADLLSRAAALDREESRAFWLQGPGWFRSGKSRVAHGLNPIDYELEVSNERKSECFVGFTAVKSAFSEIKMMSWWPKTVRVMAYISRVKKSIQRPEPRWEPTVSPKEYKEANNVILRSIQRRNFPVEWESRFASISKRSQIFQFNPFIDEEGLIRCNTRLTNMKNVEFETINPVILPG